MEADKLHNLPLSEEVYVCVYFFLSEAYALISPSTAV